MYVSCHHLETSWESKAPKVASPVAKIFAACEMPLGPRSTRLARRAAWSQRKMMEVVEAKNDDIGAIYIGLVLLVVVVVVVVVEVMEVVVVVVVVKWWYPL